MRELTLTHTITNALPNLTPANIEKILVRIRRQYLERLIYFVSKHFPANHRRHVDVDDIVQEAFLALHRALEKQTKFEHRGKILGWIYKVAFRESLNAINKALDEPVPIPTRGEDDWVDPNDWLHDKGGLDQLDPDAPAIEMMLAEWQQAINEIDELVVELEQKWKSERDRQVIGLWLSWVSYEQIKAATGLNAHDIKDTIDDFINQPVLRDEVEKLRADLLATRRKAYLAATRLHAGRSLRVLLCLPWK